MHVKQGYEFNGPDDPNLPSVIRGASLVSGRMMTPQERERWIDDYHRRFTVVETCKDCGRELVEEERNAHHRSHLSSKARRVVGMLDRYADPALYDEVARYIATMK